MPNYKDYYKAREEILDIVSMDMIGPVKEDEVLVEGPTQYYVMGKLYPRVEDGEDEQKDSDEDVTTNSAVEQITDSYDGALASTNMKDPSTMGVTFTLKPRVEFYKVTIQYAQYTNYSKDEIEKTAYNIEKYHEDIDEKTTFWVRNGGKKEFVFTVGKDDEFGVVDKTCVRSFTHKTFDSGETVITVVLTNQYKLKGFDFIEKNIHTVFQPLIYITSDDLDGKVFTSVRRQIDLADDPEVVELDMIYKKNECYGQGHGCAVEWDAESEEPYYVKSSFMPRYNLLQMKAAQIEGTPVFNMKYLHTADALDIIKNLRQFLDRYATWIDSLAGKVEKGELADFTESAQNNLERCREICSRIKAAVDKLDESSKIDGDVWKAFRLANEAMYLQRRQSLIKAEKVPEDDNINWYPFQLAFVLLEIMSFVDPKGNDRKIVDLLWFPTGGGKTEAYLGIAAFVIFYRRLARMTAVDGVTVLMRYTLRLLTIQQFERASILICACEIIRKKYAIPGEEISIGLWVGNKLTPGTIKEADSTLAKIHAGGDVSQDEADPCQIKICPWCGEKLYNKNYIINPVKKRMMIKCTKAGCVFSKEESLPVHLIDEEIYEYRPTFIVATVDKFAQITLQDKPATLFSVDKKNLPPELIIQDELHLISGPLGTMTGIYEAAITKICERDGVPVKVVASTATIRNADKQIRALYGRKFAQFPPQGVSSEDSFFAVKSSEKERPARLYIGCMGVGATFTTTLIRMYASWLYASRYLVDKGYDEKVVDNFWTLTGYFNSIRELGGAQTQVVDDIQSRYQYLKNIKFVDFIPEFTGNEKYEYAVELTSRMTNDEISDVIQTRLKVPYKKEDSQDVYDFVLASNMISVGVDVGRLGTMVVAGQPKTNAEYIQATSRVGRDNPGLVFMIYNSSRSRDRSHYEQFLRYHAALYRYVEATSLTPFSDRARDRGLQALFVTLCRYLCPDLLDDKTAGNFDATKPEIREIEKMIFKYVGIVDKRELDNVIREIKDIENKWSAEAQGELWYHRNKKKSLLKPDTEEDDRFRCMNSMRSVEKQSGLYLWGE
jgi:hypothetical protein